MNILISHQNGRDDEGLVSHGMLLLAVLSVGLLPAEVEPVHGVPGAHGDQATQLQLHQVKRELGAQARAVELYRATQTNKLNYLGERRKSLLLSKPTRSQKHNYV